MTPLGWLFPIVSCGTVTTLVTFCFYRVLRSPAAEEKVHAPRDIDTDGMNEEA